MLKLNPLYAELGVKQVIHAAGTKTTYGGTKMTQEVLEAMRLAAESFVSIVELNERIGEYIASVTGSEAGMVTSGAASGVVLSIAACMTGCDIAKIRRLPSCALPANKVVMQKIHRGSYSHMYSFPGAQIIEVGDLNDCLAEELEAALDSQTAAVAFLLGPRILQQGLSLQQTVAIAHKRHIPVIVDAAAMLPPKHNLRRFIDEGADLVTFSGGKMIHGPQNTGFLCGKTDLIKACMANASPNHAIGRPHKVSRECMAGFFTALKRFVQSDEVALMQHYRKVLTPVLQALNDIKGTHVSVEHDNLNYNVPVVAIALTSAWKGPPGEVICKLMLQADTPVFMQYFPSLKHLVVNPISLQEGEAEVVADQLSVLLKQLTQTTAGSL